MFRAIDISTSGLVAQRRRLDTIAGNIANVSTTRAADGSKSPFQRRLVQFSAADEGTTSPTGAAGVVARIDVDDRTPPRRVLDPGHPDADQDGYVSYPNVDLVTEFVNSLAAGRAYEANVAAIEMTKEMIQGAFRILQ